MDNMGIDEPRGYCPQCRSFNYHRKGCPVLRTVAFTQSRPPLQRRRGLSGPRLGLLVVAAAVAVFIVVALLG